MRPPKFPPEKILAILAEAEATHIKATCFRHGISRQTFYRWRRRYQGLGRDEARRARELSRSLPLLRRRLAELRRANELLAELEDLLTRDHPELLEGPREAGKRPKRRRVLKIQF